MASPKFETYFQEFTSDELGQIALTGILDIKDFQSVNFEIINFPNPIPNLTASVHMGKISGSTLAQEIDNFPLSGPIVIHSYKVVGPDLAISLSNAPPNTNVNIQAWVFLH